MVDTPNSRASMWKAVIQQALEDATSRAQDPAARLERDRARAWFEHQSADFAEVCELAGFEPSQVRRVALEHIKAIEEGERSKRLADRRITHAGENLTVIEWAKRTGMNVGTLCNRIRAGWTDEQVVTLPHGSRPSSGRSSTPALPERRATRVPPRTRRMSRVANLITFDGESRTMHQWADHLGITRTALHNRFADGWPLERALTEGRTTNTTSLSGVLEFNGETLTVKEWANRLGLSKNALQVRLGRPEWTLERALTTPGRSAKQADAA